MKRALLFAAAATACLACSTAGWAAPPDQGAGAQQDHQSDKADKTGKGGPQAPAGQGANVARTQSVNVGRPSQHPTQTQAVVVQTPTQHSTETRRVVVQTPSRHAPVGVTHNTTSIDRTGRPMNAQVQSIVTANNHVGQASRRFNAGAYSQPYGYVYRNWNSGQRLPAAYYARHYWITDFVGYALYGPPPGYVWVRVGASALLVNEYTGQIVAVRNDVFY